MNAKTTAITGANNQVSQITFADGSSLDTDLVVMAIGIRPNYTLAEQAGIYCEQGIVVSDTLQTYDPSIYALGECIQHRGNTFGLIAPLYDQAKVLANHLSEHGVASFQTLSAATKLKVTGINVFSVGNYWGGDDTESLIYRDKPAGVSSPDIVKKTTCPYCDVGCGIEARVDEASRSISITGLASHPSNKGRLCSKGTALADTIVRPTHANARNKKQEPTAALVCQN
jgi:NADPH-dependent 2,4-dienoyl-CoA reductase/sulfur reductase-like enzyme